MEIVTGAAGVWGEAPDVERHRSGVQDEPQRWLGLVRSKECVACGRAEKGGRHATSLGIGKSSRGLERAAVPNPHMSPGRFHAFHVVQARRLAWGWGAQQELVSVFC